MITKYEIGKSVTAAICALVFGSTMILSAVGPARANYVEVAQNHQTPAVGHNLA